MKRFISSFLVLIVLMSFLPVVSMADSYTPPFEVNAQSVYMANLDSSMMIYEKDADVKVSCDILSQLMTVVLAIENIENPESTQISMRGYIQDEMSDAGRMYGTIPLGGLYKGEKLSALNLMYAVMLQNASEAAYMLADYIGDGSESYFVQLMNHRAKELGMKNTNFTNSTGLPDENAYTTAYDAYILARHAVKLPIFNDLISVKSHNGGPTSRQDELYWYTLNSFLKSSSDYYRPDFTAVKVGSNASTGQSSSVIFAKKNGYTYALSILNCRSSTGEKSDNKAAVFSESIRLFDWAFSTFKVKTLLEQGKSFQEVPLKLCAGKDYLRCMSAHDFSALIPDEIEASSVKFDLSLPNFVNAPVKKGDMIGEATLVLSGKPIGKVAIVSAEDAQTSSLLVVMENLHRLIRGYPFKFVVCFIGISILFYVTYTILNNRNRMRYRKR